MSAETQIVVLHYPAERPRNWVLLQAAARERDLRLVSWAPHLLGLWCADGQQSACLVRDPYSTERMVQKSLERVPWSR